MQQFGINATYTLVEVATGKAVVTGQTFARVSYDNPGQQQRFANARGQRDAENRAAKVISGQHQVAAGVLFRRRRVAPSETTALFPNGVYEYSDRINQRTSNQEQDCPDEIIDLLPESRRSLRHDLRLFE